MAPLLYDHLWHNLMVAIFVIIGIIGLTLNISVIHFLLWSKCTSKVTSNRYLLINLALADILKLVFIVPLKLISNIYKHWIFGDLGCQIYGFASDFAGFLSASTLAILAIERYYMIKNPLNAFKNRTKSIIIIITLLWLYSLCWASIQFFSERGIVLEGMFTSCTFDYTSKDLKSRFSLIAMISGGYLVPLLLLLIFYSLVIKSLKYKSHSLKVLFFSQENIHSLESIEHLTTTIETESTAVNPRQKTQRSQTMTSEKTIESSLIFARNRSLEIDALKALSKTWKLSKLRIYLLKRELRVTKTVIICIGVFCLSWMPYTIIIIMAQMGADLESYTTPFTVSLPTLFTKISIILNPLIYTLVNSECKVHFKRLLRLKEKI